MARWTDLVIARRWLIIGIWAVLFALGIVAVMNLGGLLSNRFSVPGAEAERGLNLLKDRMGDRSDGSFTLVARGDPRAVQAAAQRGAKAVEGGKAGPVRDAGEGVVYVQSATPPENQDAAKATPTIRRAIGRTPGAETFLSGYPAI